MSSLEPKNTKRKTIAIWSGIGVAITLLLAIGFLFLVNNVFRSEWNPTLEVVETAQIPCVFKENQIDENTLACDYRITILVKDAILKRVLLQDAEQKITDKGENLYEVSGKVKIFRDNEGSFNFDNVPNLKVVLFSDDGQFQINEIYLKWGV